MKKLILILLMFFTVTSYAQQIDTPKIAIKIPLGETETIDGVSIKFVDVLEDSRCPEGVNCVWAGEVKISVEITNGKQSEKREITFGGIQKDESDKLLYSSSDITLTAEMVKPYPKASASIKKGDYELLVCKKLK